MNAKELSKVVGVHHNTIYNMIRTGELKAYKKNKSYEVDEYQAQKLIQSKQLLNAEENASTGADEVITLVKENQRQTLLKIIKCMNELNVTVNEIVDKSKGNVLPMQDNLFKIADNDTFKFLIYLIDTFSKNSDMIEDLENLKGKYSTENYHSNHVKRMKLKYEELESNAVKYSIEDAQVRVSNSFSLHKSDL